MNDENNTEIREEKPFLKVIVHSFFIIPFLIAVFCILLFAAINLLTSEKRTAYDYLEDVKAGGMTKRWQGAFELSRILANQKAAPEDERLVTELISAFEHSEGDDNRVRQYLALAMGRMGHEDFVQPLIKSLKGEKEANIPATIYALGMLQHSDATEVLTKYINHPNARIRSVTVVALGNIADPDTKETLAQGLADSEPNVQWGAAISLAHMGDESGKNVLFQLMNRAYLDQYSEVDLDEQNNLILSAIEASAKLNDQDLNKRIKELSETDKNMRVRSIAMKIAQ